MDDRYSPVLDDQKLHDLAVAYAQVVLSKCLRDDPTMSGTDEAIGQYLKAYYFAALHLHEADKDLDLSTLMP